MSHHKLAQKLLHKADQDLFVVRKWGMDTEIADEILGFHAQQTAEKMLKAVLANANIEFPFTHRLADLIEDNRRENWCDFWRIGYVEQN